MISFKEIPEWWAVCPKETCERAEECLRYQACRQAPEALATWTCLLPHTPTGKACKHFQPYTTVKMARGLNAIYKDVHDKRARADIRASLTGLFGSKGTYYRYKYGERQLNPQLQEKVRSIVNSFAPDAEVTFDETYDGYDFTRKVAMAESPRAWDE